MIRLFLIAFSFLLAFGVGASNMGDQLLSPNGEPNSSFPVNNPPMLDINFPLSKGKEVVSNLKVDQARLRGKAEANLFARTASSVVMVLTQESIGSGSIISSVGTVITNWHVIAGYETVAIVLKPDSPFEEISEKSMLVADVLLFDEVTDLALLKIRNSSDLDLQPLRLGKLDGLQVGYDVHAIGHPTGESWTYTKGYVSQLRNNYEWETGDGREHRAHVVQTQTPINPGNSGGPLLSSEGELVGVNSFKSSGEALNFAVRVDQIRDFLKLKEDRIAKCEPEWRSSGRNAANDADVFVYDVNCNGEPNAALEAPDDKSEAAVLTTDSTGDGRIDTIIFDTDRDGGWDDSYYDSDADGKIDLQGFHVDGDAKPYKYEVYNG